MTNDFRSHRRQFLAGAGTAAACAISAFPSPALALSEDFLLKRGDLRIGLLSSAPPYNTTEQSTSVIGLLPSIGRYFANELWLTPSYNFIDSDDILFFTPQDMFQRNGGLDIIMQAPRNWALQNNILVSKTYIKDWLSFFAIPDLHEIAIFPTNFYKRKTLAYPGYLVNHMIAYSPYADKIEIDYNVSINDLESGLPFERVINREFDCFISSYNQLQWMLKQSTHKFHLNEIYLYDQDSKVEFTVMINPASPWILPRVNKVLQELKEREKMFKIFEKYHLSSIEI